jgi:hypothetical protein
VQLLTSFGTIVLLGRMSPAIEKILRENVASGEAVERMALALSTAESDTRAPLHFRKALSRAKANITLPEESSEIAIVERVGGMALAGDGGARREAAEALRRLGSLNRSAMQEADTAAQRLGTAGAWAALFLGVMGMVISGVTIRRLQRRVLAPIAEIARAIAAHREGDRARRCSRGDATDELALIMATLNELFDYREQGVETSKPRVSAGESALVVQLLDEATEPTVALGAQAEVLAASRSALDRLAGPDGPRLRSAFIEAVQGRPAPPVVSIRRVGDSEQWLCAISAPRSDSEALVRRSPSA